MASVLQIVQGRVESRIVVSEGCVWGAHGPGCVNPTVTLSGLETGHGHHSEGPLTVAPGLVPEPQPPKAKTRAESGPHRDCGHHSTAMVSGLLVPATTNICMALAMARPVLNIPECFNLTTISCNRFGPSTFYQ